MAGDSAGVVLVDGNAPNSNLVGVNAAGRLAVELENQIVDVRPQPVPPPNLADLVVAKLEKSGGGADLRVNGSVGAVEFVFNADPVRDIKLFDFRFVVASNSVRFEGSKFVDGPALTNGVQLDIKVGGAITSLATLKITEDFLLLPLASFEKSLGGPKDYFVAVLSFGLVVVLGKGSTDFVKVTIQDDLSGTQQVKSFFQAAVTGVKV